MSSGGKLLIFAILLPIYDIALNALTDKAIGSVPIIPNAANPMPYMPALANEIATVSVINKIGIANEKYPSAIPFIKL